MISQLNFVDLRSGNVLGTRQRKFLPSVRAKMKGDLKVSAFVGNYCQVTYRPFDPEITLA